jgi:hypothetical protein
MIECNDGQWWNGEKLKKGRLAVQQQISDSDYFQIEFEKIEEALHNICRLMKKYVEGNEV